MPPVRARRISAKTLRKPLRRTRARSSCKDLAVIQPRLKVIKRCLDYHGWLENLRLHPLERFRTEVVNEAQSMKACRPDVDMRALGIFVTKPLDGCLDIESALPFPQNHLADVTLNAKVEAFTTHCSQLCTHRPLYDQRRFLAAFIALGFRHWGAVE